MEIVDRNRRTYFSAVVLTLCYPLVACGKKSRIKEVVVNVMLYSYLDISIYDVYLNNEMIGGSASLAESPYGQHGTVVGVSIPLGPQTLTWRSAATGETFVATNKILLSAKDIPDDVIALGVHIYPDSTFEMIFSQNVLEQSKRGMTYAKKFQKNGK